MPTPSFSLAAFKAPLAAAGFALLAACASVTPYQPADKRGEGYTDQALDTGRYRITFEGNSSTELATIENYVLFRAAEISLANGYDYFVILDSNTETMRRFVTNGSTFGGGGFGRRGFFYGGGFRGGFASTTATTRERRSYTVGAIIEGRRGDKPAGNPNAYDARQIIDNVGQVIQRPGDE
ncbi:MAG: hypothetical protein AAGD92_13465 [Pseudomonadota bacterium]